MQLGLPLDGAREVSALPDLIAAPELISLPDLIRALARELELRPHEPVEVGGVRLELAVPPVLSFEVFGIPRTQGSKVPGISKTGRLFVREQLSHSLREWREAVREGCKAAMKETGVATRPGQVAVELEFVHQRPDHHYRVKGGQVTDELRPQVPDWYLGGRDVDKLQRALFDALSQGGLYRNDNRISRLRDVRRVYGEFNGVRIWVWDLPSRRRPELTVVSG